MQFMTDWRVLLFLFITTVHGAGRDEDIQLSEAFGGSHGIAFSDINSLQFAQVVRSITIRSGERVDALTLQIAAPAELTLSHGGAGGTDNTLVLADGEYITSMEIHWAKKGTSTLVFFLSFDTNAGNSVSGGTMTENNSTVTPPEGFQLSGFFGRAEGALDQLGAIWTRINATGAALTDNMGSDWYGDRIRNWLGPTIGEASDSACYRRTEPFSSQSVCPLGYAKDPDNCIAQCSMSYPVVCFRECIPQNDDCSLEIFTKAASVATAAFNTATAGVFNALFSQYKSAKQGFVCASNIVGVMKSLVYYLRFTQTTAPAGDVEEMLAVAYQSNVVLLDIPIAVCNCLGIPVPAGAKFSNTVLGIVLTIVKQAITNGDQILSSATSVLALLTNSSATNSTADTSVDALQDLIDSNSTCGYQLKNLTDHVIAEVNQLRNSTAVDDIHVSISNSSLVLHDIPTATNNCMRELLATKTLDAAFETRDLLRKTFGVITEQLVATGISDLGASAKESDYMLEVANMGLTVLGGLEPTGIAYMASQFVQPTCGPTSFIGEIDDGTLYDALGLSTVDEAFEGSYGTWSKKGDGAMILLFESTDTKDVTVVIHSGGDSVAEVDVNAGATATWNSSISTLQGSVLYLDRWRADVIGIPGSGGGSLVLWIPWADQGGHLTMHVRVNGS